MPIYRNGHYDSNFAQLLKAYPTVVLTYTTNYAL
jgi:hypothetical protein